MNALLSWPISSLPKIGIFRSKLPSATAVACRVISLIGWVIVWARMTPSTAVSVNAISMPEMNTLLIRLIVAYRSFMSAAM
ncbi:hypothetical protein D3C76_1362070 [compost metagenome]